MIPNLLTILDFQKHPYFIADDTDFDNQLLDDTITQHQEIVLRDLLGEAEFAKFTTDYTGDDLDWTSQEWIDFVVGVDYVVSNVASVPITIEWSGIKDVLKYFVYAEWLRQIGRYQTKTGNFASTVENANPVSRQAEYVNTYNIGIDRYGEDWTGKFRTFNYELYCSDHYFTRSYYNRIERYGLNTSLFDSVKLKNTAYNFFYWYQQRDSSKFADWLFKILEIVTRAGL